MARRELDFYETAPWQVDALVDHLPELSGTVLCPCVGDGSLMDRLRVRRPDLNIITSDIDTNRVADSHGDATAPYHWESLQAKFGRIDWVVENPPFNVEIDIAKCAYEYARKGVVLMSRISFVEPTGTKKKPGRGPWLAAHPRIKQIVLQRYSFTGNGASDSATTEWLVWAKPGIEIANPGCHSAYGYKPEAKR